MTKLQFIKALGLQKSKLEVFNHTMNTTGGYGRQITLDGKVIYDNRTRSTFDMKPMKQVGKQLGKQITNQRKEGNNEPKTN